MNLEVEWFGHRKCNIWNLQVTGALKVHLIFFPLQCVPGPCWSFLTEPLRSFHPPKVKNWQLAAPRLQLRAMPRMSLPGQCLWSCVASSPDLAKLGGGRSDLSGSIHPSVCLLQLAYAEFCSFMVMPCHPLPVPVGDTAIYFRIIIRIGVQGLSTSL